MIFCAFRCHTFYFLLNLFTNDCIDTYSRQNIYFFLYFQEIYGKILAEGEIKMKKILILIFMFLCGWGIFGNDNSTTIIVNEYETYEPFPISDPEINIISENLIFDFSSYKEDVYPPVANVTANYVMKNVGEDRVVQLGLPVVSNYECLKDLKTRKIIANGEVIDPKIWIGPETKDYFRSDDVDFSDFVTTDYQILEGIEGTLYTANFDGSKLKLQYSTDNRFFIGENIGFIIDENEIEFRMGGYRSYYIYVIGPEVTVIDQAGAFDSIRLTGEEFIDYLARCYEDDVLAPYLFNYQLRQFQNSSQKTVEVQDILDNPRCFLLVYDVLLLGNSYANEVSTFYEVVGNFIRGYSIYRYDYYTQTAKKWVSFQNLHLTIIPPSIAPYLVADNYGLQKQDNGSYTAFLEKLPTEDFYFEISKIEKPYYVTWYIRNILFGIAYIIDYFLHHPVILVLSIILIILINAFFIYLAVVIIRKIIRRKKSNL